jgi:hypothetical protein
LKKFKRRHKLAPGSPLANPARRSRANPFIRLPGILRHMHMSIYLCMCTTHIDDSDLLFLYDPAFPEQFQAFQIGDLFLWLLSDSFLPRKKFVIHYTVASF